MNSFRADLHCHSTSSDGTYTPEDLVKLAVEIGLNALSITDHDTIDAYEKAIPIAKQLSLPLLTGIEFSTVLLGKSVHLLGYGFKLDHPAVISLCAKHKQRRTERNLQILENLKKIGLPVDLHHGESSIGRPHIAQAMMEKGYVQSVQEAFKKYLGEGKPAFARGEAITIQETIDALHAASGLAVIAHPHLIEDPSLVKNLLEYNFDGIECYYAKFSLEQNKRWLEIAEKKQWLITGGSDFHGSIKPTIPLGASWVDQTNWERILCRTTIIS